MFTGSMMKLKSILYGTLPFYYTKVFEPSSPKLAYYDYFRKRGYTRYPYDFAAEYLEMSIAVQWDKEKELPYVMHRGSKGSPDKPGGLSIQLCKSEKKEFYIRYSS